MKRRVATPTKPRARVAKTTKPRAASDARLFAAVYANPDDDAPREALARHLKTKRDPRGEFIELQLADARNKDPKRKPRIAALLAKHRDEWLGPLLRAFQLSNGMKWERGFLSAARLAVPRMARGAPDPMENWIGMPELATLRSLDLDTGTLVVPYKWRKRFLFESPLRNLREIRGFPRMFFGKLLSSTPAWKLERVDVELDGNAGRHEALYAKQILAGFADARGLPHLRELELTFSSSRPDPFTWLWTTPAGRRLKSLTTSHFPYLLEHWHPLLVKHAAAIELEQFGMRTIVDVTLERTNGSWSRLTGELCRGHRTNYANWNLTAALAKVPAITDVDVKHFRRTQPPG